MFFIGNKDGFRMAYAVRKDLTNCFIINKQVHSIFANLEMNDIGLKRKRQLVEYLFDYRKTVFMAVFGTKTYQGVFLNGSVR